MSVQTLSAISLKPISLDPVSLEQVLERILMTRQITRADQHLLVTQSNLTTREHTLLNQVFDRLQTGRLKVVD